MSGASATIRSWVSSGGKGIFVLLAFVIVYVPTVPPAEKRFI